MQRFILATGISALLATAAYGQAAQSGSSNPAVKDSEPHTVAAPAKGESSFTEGQAKERLEKAGYNNISALKKSGGVWHANAMKNGKEVAVSLDYKGNVAVR